MASHLGVPPGAAGSRGRLTGARGAVEPRRHGYAFAPTLARVLQPRSCRLYVAFIVLFLHPATGCLALMRNTMVWVMRDWRVVSATLQLFASINTLVASLPAHEYV